MSHINAQMAHKRINVRVNKTYRHQLSTFGSNLSCHQYYLLFATRNRRNTTPHIGLQRGGLCSPPESNNKRLSNRLSKEVMPNATPYDHKRKASYHQRRRKTTGRGVDLARVMGYFRPVSDFNIGKKGEHAERKYLTESNELTRTPVCTP